MHKAKLQGLQPQHTGLLPHQACCLHSCRLYVGTGALGYSGATLCLCTTWRHGHSAPATCISDVDLKEHLLTILNS